jgi:diguanylate cyclase (GGDEF)-like protein
MINLATLIRFNLTVWIGKRSLLARAGTTAVTFALVVVVLYLAPPDTQVTALFLIPISFGAWYLSPIAGWVGAFLSSAVLFVYEIKHHHDGQGIVFLNLFLNILMYSFFAFITSEVRALYAREHELSLQDPLTGLMNRRALSGALIVESRRLHRRHYPLTLAYIDIDDFKKVNDLHGHATGDTYLRQLATVLKNTVRATDFVARLGGDEFAVLLPETGPTAAQLAITKVQENLLALVQQQKPPVTVSIGAVTFETTADSPAEMIRVADEVMYEVKRSGKNQVAYKIFRAGTLWPAVTAAKVNQVIG